MGIIRQLSVRLSKILILLRTTVLPLSAGRIKMLGLDLRDGELDAQVRLGCYWRGGIW